MKTTEAPLLPVGTRLQVVPTLRETTSSPGLDSHMRKFESTYVTIHSYLYTRYGEQRYYIEEDYQEFIWGVSFFNLSTFNTKEQPYEYW